MRHGGTEFVAVRDGGAARDGNTVNCRKARDADRMRQNGMREAMQIFPAGADRHNGVAGTRRLIPMWSEADESARIG